MGIIKNLLAMIGLLVIITILAAFIKYSSEISTLRSFDEGAAAAYMEMGQKILETGNAAEATIWKVPVKEGLSPEDVEASMRSIASDHGIKNVGELPLSKEAQKSQRS